MKAKRNTKSRSVRTLVQTVLAGVVSIPMMESIITKMMPFLSEGNWHAAGIAATTAVLAYILSVLQNWLENHGAERRTSATVED